MPVAKRQTPPTSLAARIAAVQQTPTEGYGQYMTTVNSCLCADHKFRRRVCKHMLFVREREELERAKVVSVTETKRLCQAMHDFF